MNLSEIFMLCASWDQEIIRGICQYIGCVIEDSKLDITHGSHVQMENIHEDKYWDYCILHLVL